jgi:hypothetical protein
LNYFNLIVTSDVTFIQLTATTASNSLSTLTAYGSVGSALSEPKSILSDAISPVVPLVTGNTQLTLTVLAEDAQTTSTYTMRIHRPSTDCTIAGFSMRPFGSGFSPAFDSSVDVYSNEVAHSVSSASFSVLAHHAASILVLLQLASDGVTWTPFQSLVSGVDSSWMTIPVGSSGVAAEITAEDGATRCVYEVRIQRLSNDAAVWMLDVDGQDGAGVGSSLNDALIPGFDSSRPVYALSVDNSVQSATFTLHPAYPLATIEYETTAARFLGSTPLFAAQAINTPSAKIALAAGSTFITIRVTSQDATAVSVFTLTITRAADLTSFTLFDRPNGLPLSTIPAFTPGQPTLTASVADLIEAFYVAATYATPDAGWSVDASPPRLTSPVHLAPSGATCSAGLLLIAESPSSH